MLKMTWMSKLLAAATVAAVGLWTVDADAQQRGTAEVPVQVGVGPTGSMLASPVVDGEVGWGGALFDDQPVYSGLRLDVTAVIDSDLVDRHPRLVPGQYRSQIQQMGEVRYRPGVLAAIPSSLHLSPPIVDAQAWGATWSLIGVGLAPISEPFRLSAGASLIGTLMYIGSESVDAPYFFARPGIEINIDLEVPVTDRFLISFGWASQFHAPPQPLSENLIAAGSFDQHSLWHIGQFYVQGHFRIPYSYSYGR